MPLRYENLSLAPTNVIVDGDQIFTQLHAKAKRLDADFGDYHKLANGETLDHALRSSLGDLDGTFTYLVSTKYGLGYAKDQWSAKPLVTMETDEIIAIASEEIALRGVFNQEIDRMEPQNSEVMTWLL